MELSVKTLESKDIYKLMTGAIVPRPIGWVSSRAADGTTNLAPYSYFNAVSSSPPALMFSAGKKTAGTKKDSVQNILDTGEFVVNIVTLATAEAMNASAVTAPHGISEFALAGVTEADAVTVNAPRVKESPVHFECKLLDLYKIGNNSVVFGEITHIHVDESVLLEGYKIDTASLQPVARLAGINYAGLGEIFRLERPTYKA